MSEEDKDRLPSEGDEPATDDSKPEAEGDEPAPENASRGGYKKIDKKYCWPKGKSGNPSGPKKRTLTFDDHLDQAMRAKVTATENGRRTKKSREQLSAIRLANETVHNTRTAFAVAERRRRRREQESLLQGPEQALPEDDQTLIDAYFLRHFERLQANMKSPIDAVTTDAVEKANSNEAIAPETSVTFPESPTEVPAEQTPKGPSV